MEKENESDEKKEEENQVNELKVFACLAAEVRCCGGSGDGEWMENDGPWLLKWSAIELTVRLDGFENQVSFLKTTTNWEQNGRGNHQLRP